MKIKLLGILVLVTSCLPAKLVFAQTSGSWRFGHGIADSMVITLDTLSIIPQTFVLQQVEHTRYRLDPLTATLYLTDSSLLGKTLFYQYRVFSLDYSKPHQHKSLSLIEPLLPQYQPAVTTIRPLADIQAEDMLLSTGSISRGVSVGNNQDLVLNSALNLQLSGRLSEDVEIIAAITDNNIPIQAEGNTQVLQDFNKVYITLKYKNILHVDAGDVELASPRSDFLTVSRNLSGLNISTNYPFKKSACSMMNFVGGGVAKGKYVRQTITPQNGVQGPYKLYGINHEINIVMIAGSERVYVNGILLTRGQDRDYTVDYNSAELTFTPAMLITDEKRIVVEFEYTDKHYTRYNIYMYNELIGGHKNQFKLRVNYFQEQDLKNQSLEPELDNAQKKFIASLGDATATAYYPFVDSAVYSPDRILYRMVDTMVEGNTYHNVYVCSSDEHEQLYSLGFTYMGAQRGDYVLLRSTSNGRVFGWVAPLNGMKQGDYEPVMLLNAPQLVQMATIAGECDFNGRTRLKAEMALSNYDRNTFSKKDNRDNVGFAGSVAFSQTAFLKNRQKDTSDWKLLTDLNWQFVHKNFHAIESFRNVEFARDYNLSTDYATAHSDQILRAAFAIANPQWSTTRYTLNWLARFREVNAWRHELISQNRFSRVSLNTKTSFLHSRDSLQKTRFLMSDNLLSYKFKQVELGFTDLVENNVFRDDVSDTLRANSYMFNEAMAYIKNTDSTKWQYLISYKNRVEAAPCRDRMHQNNRIHETAFRLGFDKIKNQHFGTKVTYRYRQVRDSVDRFVSENYFVGNLEYSGRFFHNALMLNTYYEAGSGLELKKTFTYLKVATGQGTHVWNDYNGNGLEELDEFEPAAFRDEADYVKVWLSGTEYVNTYNNLFTQSIQLRPAAVWNGKHGFRRFLARFVNTTLFRSQQKNGNTLCWQSFNPFRTNMKDSNLVGSLTTLNNTLSFNNSVSKFAFDFIVQKTQNKNLLYYGYEQNTVSFQQVVLKSAPCKFITLQTSYVHTHTGNNSEWLPTRCYAIEQHEAGGKLQLQFKNAYYGTLAYTYQTKRNLTGEEKMWQHRAAMEFNYRTAKRGNLDVSLQYIYINGILENSTTVDYLMSGGLSEGQNALWSVSYQLSVTDYLLLSLQYDGRVSEGNKVIHLGNVTLKAQF